MTAKDDHMRELAGHILERLKTADDEWQPGTEQHTAMMTALMFAHKDNILEILWYVLARP
jgi:hypothetical protein